MYASTPPCQCVLLTARMCGLQRSRELVIESRVQCATTTMMGHIKSSVPFDKPLAPWARV